MDRQLTTTSIMVNLHRLYGTQVTLLIYSEKIRLPLRWFGGNDDLLADLTDINNFWALLNPEAKGFLKIYTAGHVTFVWGLDTSPWMNDVLSFFPKSELNQ